MSKLKLEVGKKYLNGNGEIVTIVEDAPYNMDEHSRFKGHLENTGILWYAEDDTFNCAWN